ncbi:unnamed protein product [Angiostrongylus costaricensis]|uniref:Helitron helicase n=1 Tax=Angiostrongylus costaricensis TaxID=334426 RepID=A0A158PHY2_ANGCS|nr:unnamed protein product [Angiostrongylus costaricensis]
MMNDMNRSVYLIENAIDRLIEYGDRIHSISSRSHPEQRRQESVSSEKETVDNFLYTVTKGGRRCTIPGKMFSKRLPDSWVMLRFQLFDEDGTELLNLKTEIMGEYLRNTVVNGKPTDFC